MKLEGVFLYYDKENGNGRIYTKEVAEDIINQFKEKDKSVAYGECGMPDSFVTNLVNVSHVVKDIWLDEKEKCIKGTIETLDLDKGKKIETLMESGIPLSVASRGSGTINEKGEVENYQLYAFDIIPTEKSSFKGPLKITD